MAGIPIVETITFSEANDKEITEIFKEIPKDTEIMVSERLFEYMYDHMNLLITKSAVEYMGISILINWMDSSMSIKLVRF